MDCFIKEVLLLKIKPNFILNLVFIEPTIFKEEDTFHKTTIKWFRKGKKGNFSPVIELLRTRLIYSSDSHLILFTKLFVVKAIH